MIKSNELRIGNLVMIYYRDKPRISKIKSIFFNDIEQLYFIETDYGFKVNIVGILEIKLTEEILNKVGFIDSTKHVYEYKNNSNLMRHCVQSLQSLRCFLTLLQ